MSVSNPRSPLPPALAAAADRLRDSRVLLCGLGNIGGPLALLLAPHVGFLRLVDRDHVEAHDAAAKGYRPEDGGRAKVDVTAEWIEQLAPHVQVERRVVDLEDLPRGDFADVDMALAGLDSLRARQILAEQVYPHGIPLLDGAVGEPLLVRAQVQLPGQACLQCGWGAAHYRQLTAEYPCRPGAAAATWRTGVPSCAGAAAAALMIAQCFRVLGEDPPRESYEINGDLLAGRFVTARRRRNPRCRYRHERMTKEIRLGTPFCVATVADLVAAVQREFGSLPVALEFRRGILPGDLFAGARFASLEQLHRTPERRLAEFGLTPRDRVVVRPQDSSDVMHLCLAETNGSAP